MLDEHLPRLLEEVLSIRLPLLGDRRCVLEWRQPDVFSATASFLIERRLKVTWFYLTGRHPPPPCRRPEALSPQSGQDSA
jgi:hypothetical protein